MVGRDEEVSLSKTYMSSSSFCIFWKKSSLILCLNVFGLLDDFKSDGRLFHIFGPRQDKHFCPEVLLRNGNSNLNLDLRVNHMLLI